MKKRTISNIVIVGLSLFHGIVFGQQWSGPNDQTSTISRTGNVGIGTSTPAFLLDVSGTFRSHGYLRTTGISNGNGYYADDGAGSTIFSITRQPNNETRFQSYGFHTFYSGNSTGSEKMRIDGSGNVGIGTSTPAFLLDVSGTLRSYGYLRTTGISDGSGYFADDGVGSTIFSITRQPNNETRFQSYGFHTFYSGNSSGSEKMRIDGSGNVAIGTTDPKGYKLAVAGKAIAEEVTVKLQGSWPDYVFNSDYNLLSLEEIKTYIDINKHLPEVPSAKEMEANGVQLGEMNMLLLKKIEELTLYVIALKKSDEENKKEIESLKSRIK